MSSMARVLRVARLPAALMVALLVLGMAGPAWSVTEQELEQARQQQGQAAAARAAALGDLDAAVAAFDEVNSEYESLMFTMAELRSRIEAYDRQSRGLREKIRQRAVEAYMKGPEREAGGQIFSSQRAQEAIVAREVLAQAVAEDVASLDSLEAVTAEMARLQIQLDADSARANSLRIEAEAVAQRMFDLLAQKEEDLRSANQNVAQTEAALAAQRAREEAERIRRAALYEAVAGRAGGVSDAVTPGFVCPVQGYSAFRDTWGAPRSGGTRSHTGVDMMAPQNTLLVAAADGVIKLGQSALGGNTVWLYADHGVGYFYAHLDHFVDGQSTGDRVSAGTIIGYVGDTGDPAPGAYHLHFGITPSGMGAVNPYPTVVRHCN
jgi:murein DD-endopeptidase MepM/ murein hydrolase activator NlpD